MNNADCEHPHTANVYIRNLCDELVSVQSAATKDSFRYSCAACDSQSEMPGERAKILLEANQHAGVCRATSNPQPSVAILREIAMDIRAELPRVDARAAAVVALSAAVLVGTVQVTPSRMPTFAFGVAGCVFLTVSLLISSTVLLPSRTGRARASSTAWARFDGPEGLVAELVGWDERRYLATVIIELAAAAHVRHRRLALGLWAGVVAISILALGAILDVALPTG